MLPLRRLPALRRLRKPLLSGLMGLSAGLGGLAPAPAAAQSVGLPSLPVLLQSTMSWGKCWAPPHSFIVTPVFMWCGHVFPGAFLSYRKPVALVEVTCKAGTSNFLGPAGFGQLLDGVLGTVLQQDCGSFDQSTGTTKPRYYDVHVFRITPPAMMLSSNPGAGALASLCSSPFDVMASPFGLVNQGLVPVYFSELDPTWKNPLPSPGGLVDTALNATVGAPGQMAKGALCAAEGVAATIPGWPTSFPGPSALQTCIGGWGNMAPIGGWVQHKVEPVAAMTVAARAYGRAADFGLVEREQVTPAPTGGMIKDSPLDPVFDLDYPPNSPAIPGFMAGGSSCYGVGTWNPAWYMKGGDLIPGMGDIMGGVTTALGAAAGIVGGVTAATITPVNKGYFVATFWRNTSCIISPCSAFLPVPWPPYF
jgi:hypothetical protein